MMRENPGIAHVILKMFPVQQVKLEELNRSWQYGLFCKRSSNLFNDSVGINSVSRTNIDGNRFLGEYWSHYVPKINISTIINDREPFALLHL